MPMIKIKRFALLLGAVLFLSAVVTSLHSITRAQPAIAEISSMPVIIIDAGHPGTVKTEHAPENI